MSARRPPRRGASPRARSLTWAHPASGGARALRRAVIVASLLLGGGVAAGSTAEAWTVNPPPLAPIAHAATALPPRGVPFSQLLAVAPQLAPGSTTAGGSSLGPGGAVSAQSAAAGSIVQVQPGATIQVRSSPGGAVVEQLDSRSDTGSQPRAFTVYAVDGSSWLGVSVPALGGHLGWISADPADVFIRPALDEIEVSLARRSLELLDGGRLVFSTPVVIGSADTPTPAGQFSVDDIVRFTPASPEYGIGALALSVPPPGRNWVYWRVAIHGLNNLGQLGGTGSLGCVHVPTADLRRLLEVPVGTPVDIVA